MRGLENWLDLCPVKLHVDDNDVRSFGLRRSSEK